MRRDLLRTAFAVLLVGSLVANPLGVALLDRANPTGSASAISSVDPDDPCGPLGVTAPNSDCNPGNDVYTPPDNFDWLDIYLTLSQVEAQTQSFRELMENYVQDTEDVAWLLVERELYQGYTNGSSKTTAVINAKERVKDYYTVKTQNTINAWNNAIASLQAAKTDHSDISGNVVIANVIHASTSGYGENAKVHYANVVDFPTRSVTLPNGSTAKIRQVEINVKVSHDAQSACCGEMTTHTETFNWTYDFMSYNLQKHFSYTHESGTDSYTSEFTYKFNSLKFQPPSNTDYPHQYMVYAPYWNDLYNNVTDMQDELFNETDTYADAVWSNLSEDKAKDILSQVNVMNHMTTDIAGSENRSFSDAVAGLLYSGFAVPNLSESAYQTIRFEPSSGSTITVDGYLASTAQPPNGTWQVGTVYNSHNVPGTQTVIASDGQYHTINGTFEITGVYGDSGDRLDVSAVSVPERNYQVTDTSDARQRWQEIAEVIEWYESQQPQDGSGGEGDSSSPGIWTWLSSLVGLSSRLVVALLAVALVVLVVVS